MPYLKIQTNKEFDDKKIDTLIGRLSRLISTQLGKPENYVMVAFNYKAKMSFAADKTPTVFIELKSIGLDKSKNSALSKVLCNFIEKNLEIAKDRVYIVFSDIDRSMWGWNGSTF